MKDNIKELREDLNNYITELNKWIAGFCVAFFIIIFVLLIWNLSLTSKIADLPHKYCHNETIYSSITNLTFEQTQEIDQTGITMACGYQFYSNGKYYCVFSTEKEVCEIK